MIDLDDDAFSLAAPTFPRSSSTTFHRRKTRSYERAP
jgi:hypothetical protein